MGEPGIEGDERYCIMRTGSYNIFMEYCTCEFNKSTDLIKINLILVHLPGNSKDGCNDAGSLNPKLIFVALTMMTSLIARRFF